MSHRAGYPDGKTYAMASLGASFSRYRRLVAGADDAATCGLGARRDLMRTREDSFDIQAQLGIKIAGDQKLTPFPHWTLSTRTLRQALSACSSQPVSDWFVGGLLRNRWSRGGAPSIHNRTTLREAVDFYYGMGGLVNFYSHTLSTGEGDAGQLVPEYINYCVNTNALPAHVVCQRRGRLRMVGAG